MPCQPYDCEAPSWTPVWFSPPQQLQQFGPSECHRFGELLKEKPAAAALPSPILRSSPIKLAVVTMSASPMHSSCALKEEETPISPILGKNHALKAVRKRLFECNKVEPPSDENEEEQETSEYDLNFEPGSNKWECVDMESFTTSEDKTKAPRRKQTPEVAGIFQRLRAIPKYSGLEMRPPGQVSTKIKGVKRRQLPGWCCTNCEEVNN
ncbi:uncharacterized protein LOC127750974 [Frankliniella occidentalis]|uniref:Uncharacterized protein LOC127750974 n=1 Tax=Frankliniella occidentalis TaxID=133901 RepID=A0A9C6X5Z9_FRAOC|nr:uncharacterized protein LOC127750974 [Frankliniella occidentalis]